MNCFALLRVADQNPGEPLEAYTWYLISSTHTIATTVAPPTQTEQLLDYDKHPETQAETHSSVL